MNASKLEIAKDKTRELYSTAKEWLPENYPTAAVIGGAAIGIGLAGYLIGRSSSPSLAKRAKKSLSEAEEKASDKFSDMDRLFKFVKLWMLYKAAT